MSESTVAIVGSGIVGSTIAYLLTQRGIDVEIFEKGPDYPYPHRPQFLEWRNYLYENPAYLLPKDLKYLTISGDYPTNLNRERHMVTGGSATQWEAITLRMLPNDFKTKTLYGYGKDWPITYNDLEPYYCKAEALLGVSGTDSDNPFAPRRSRPYPLSPFELSYDDVILADRLRKHDILLHTTPQARTRNRYHNRPACINYRMCRRCPTGARYSPNYHLLSALKTGLCKIRTNVSVRKIVTDKSGQAKELIYHPNEATTDKIHSAKVIIIAAGAIESARLLLLSSDNRYPDGIGNSAGHVGKHLMLHHLWKGFIQYKDYLFPGRFGGYTGQSYQFLDPSRRGIHGGIKIEFTSRTGFYLGPLAEKSKTGSEMIESMKSLRHQRPITFHSESITSPKKYITLSEKLDRFGDPYAHVHYESTDFEHESYLFARKLFDRFVAATGAENVDYPKEDKYNSGAHHMGAIRMGHDIRDSVVDKFCKVHSSQNLFVVGGSNFVSSSAVNPTLTITALAIRSAEYIMDQIL